MYQEDSIQPASLSAEAFREPTPYQLHHGVAFLRARVSIRIPALEALQLQEKDISPDLVLSLAAVAARGWGGHQEQPVEANITSVQINIFPETTHPRSSFRTIEASGFGNRQFLTQGRPV